MRQKLLRLYGITVWDLRPLLSCCWGYSLGLFFSDWSPVNSNNFGDRAADRITVCHGIFRHGSSQFVNAISRQSQANAAFFPTKYNFRLQHFDNACAIWDHQKWQTLCSHTFPLLYLIYSHGSSGSKKSTPLLLWHLNVPREIQFGCRPPKYPKTVRSKKKHKTMWNAYFFTGFYGKITGKLRNQVFPNRKKP